MIMNYGRIYKITNKLNGMSYIGQTTNTIMYRFNTHCNEKRNNRHISNAIQKYGKDNFTIELIAETNNQHNLNKLESFYTLKFNTLRPNGYNFRAGGKQNGICSNELRKKISEAKIGKPLLKRRGEVRSLEQRLKISRTLGGKSILMINLITKETSILQTARDGIKLGFNPSNIVSICRGRRSNSKGYTFQYINDANQSGSTDSNKSEHAQRIELEAEKSE